MIHHLFQLKNQIVDSKDFFRLHALVYGDWYPSSVFVEGVVRCYSLKKEVLPNDRMVAKHHQVLLQGIVQGLGPSSRLYHHCLLAL